MWLRTVGRPSSEPIRHLAGEIGPVGHSSAVTPVLLSGGAKHEIALHVVPGSPFESFDWRIPRKNSSGSGKIRKAKTIGSCRDEDTRCEAVPSFDPRAERI